MPVIIHRDLGREFDHEDTAQCPCCPHRIDDDDARTLDQIMEESENAERKH